MTALDASMRNIGSVAAFVSHSWRDSGAAKWDALQSWVAEPRAERAGSMVWLDKARAAWHADRHTAQCPPVAHGPGSPDVQRC